MLTGDYPQFYNGAVEKSKNQIVIYQTKSGAIELKGDVKHNTIWASQMQISDLFGVDRTVVTKHINNLFKAGELNRKSNVQKMHIPNSDKLVSYYSLDLILAVGYRTNSKVAIDFRRWATGVLKEYIVEGYAVNKARIFQNYQQFLKTVEDIKLLLPSGELINPVDVVELISLYADTWVSLEAYDKGELKVKQTTKKSVDLTAHKLTEALVGLKSELLAKGLVTQIFGVEQNPGTLVGIVGNIMQSFDGKELYPSVEEKSAHLLYFMIKDHPFTDGNKRSAAYAFIWFLKQAGILNTGKLTPSALTALTILIAQSNPKDREKVIKLITAIC